MSSTVVSGLTMQIRSTVSPCHARRHDERPSGGELGVAPRLVCRRRPADAPEQHDRQLGLDQQLEVRHCVDERGARAGDRSVVSTASR